MLKGNGQIILAKLDHFEEVKYVPLVTSVSFYLSETLNLQLYYLYLLTHVIGVFLTIIIFTHTNHNQIAAKKQHLEIGPIILKYPTR